MSLSEGVAADESVLTVAPDDELDGAVDDGLNMAVTGPRDDKTWMVVARFLDVLDAVQFAAKMLDARVYRNGKLYQKRVAGVWVRNAKKPQ